MGLKRSSVIGSPDQDCHGCVIRVLVARVDIKTGKIIDTPKDVLTSVAGDQHGANEKADCRFTASRLKESTVVACDVQPDVELCRCSSGWAPQVRIDVVFCVDVLSMLSPLTQYSEAEPGSSQIRSNLDDDRNVSECAVSAPIQYQIPT